jgi:hypothetical protein
MSIFDDLAAEQDRLEKILAGLDEAQWGTASAAAGWTVADVVLHLAQSDEAVPHCASSSPARIFSSRSCSAARSSKMLIPEYFHTLLPAGRAVCRMPRHRAICRLRGIIWTSAGS